MCVVDLVEFLLLRRAGGLAAAQEWGRGGGIPPVELWTGAESNRRHVDFQSTALPTELPVLHCGRASSRNHHDIASSFKFTVDSQTVSSMEVKH